jgi:hypothetical protein
VPGAAGFGEEQMVRGGMASEERIRTGDDQGLRHAGAVQVSRIKQLSAVHVAVLGTTCPGARRCAMTRQSITGHNPTAEKNFYRTSLEAPFDQVSA